MSAEPADVAADVHALIQDLLPLLLPGARFDTDAAEVVLPVGRAEPRAVTTTIVARCARVPQHEWPALVEEWLLQVSDRAAMAIGQIELLGDVRRLLRMRIVPRLPEGVREGFVLAEFGPYFDALVVIDHPKYGGPLTADRAALLHLEDIGTWAVDGTQEELIGLTVTERPLTMTESVLLLTKPGCRYVSMALPELADHLPRRCPHGALVGVPDHTRILVHPADSTAALDVLPVFADVVAEMYDGSADRCSRDVYWWYRGYLVRAPTDGPLPRELRVLAARLPPPGDAARPVRAWRRVAGIARAAVRRFF